ncbi:hypothetical protein ABIA13_002170 [Sinorhizobium fredii]
MNVYIFYGSTVYSYVIYLIFNNVGLFEIADTRIYDPAHRS